MTIETNSSPQNLLISLKEGLRDSIRHHFEGGIQL